MSASSERARGVDVTVLLATRDRAVRLAETLEGLARLVVGAITWELIVVDNGSRDSTPAVLATATARLPLRVLGEPVPGKNRALNAAVPHARGELVAFIDDDIRVGPEWLTTVVDTAGRWPAADVFAGRIVPVFPAHTPAWIQQHDFGRAAFGRFDLAQSEGPTEHYGFGGNLVIRAPAVQAHRFDERMGPVAGGHYAMGSETEYLRRIRQAGHQTVYAPDAVVEHVIEPHQVTVDWLFGRSYRLGRGLCRMGAVRIPGIDRRLGWPLRLTAQTVKAGVRHAAAARLSAATAFDAGLRYHYLRGVRDEARQALQTRRTGRYAPSGAT